MDISLLLKAAGVGLICAVLCQILSKSGRDEQAMMLSVVGIVVVFLMIVTKLESLVGTLKSVFGL